MGSSAGGTPNPAAYPNISLVSAFGNQPMANAIMNGGQYPSMMNFNINQAAAATASSSTSIAATGNNSAVNHLASNLVGATPDQLNNALLSNISANDIGDLFARLQNEMNTVSASGRSTPMPSGTPAPSDANITPNTATSAATTTTTTATNIDDTSLANLSNASNSGIPASLQNVTSENLATLSMVQSPQLAQQQAQQQAQQAQQRQIQLQMQRQAQQQVQQQTNSNQLSRQQLLQRQQQQRIAAAVGSNPMLMQQLNAGVPLGAINAVNPNHALLMQQRIQQQLQQQQQQQQMLQPLQRVQQQQQQAWLAVLANSGNNPAALNMAAAMSANNPLLVAAAMNSNVNMVPGGMAIPPQLNPLLTQNMAWPGSTAMLNWQNQLVNPMATTASATGTPDPSSAKTSLVDSTAVGTLLAAEMMSPPPPSKKARTASSTPVPHAATLPVASSIHGTPSEGPLSPTPQPGTPDPMGGMTGTRLERIDYTPIYSGSELLENVPSNDPEVALAPDQFMQTLEIVHHRKGTPFLKIPACDGKILDMRLFYFKVQELGGHVLVSDSIT
jgi:hypothetical protein